jgi:hypothetical protein
LLFTLGDSFLSKRDFVCGKPAILRFLQMQAAASAIGLDHDQARSGQNQASASLQPMVSGIAFYGEPDPASGYLQNLCLFQLKGNERARRQLVDILCEFY